MRCLVVSDIHANLAALDAVIYDAGHFELVWCLGDIVGYGPDPNECIARLRMFPHISLSGNHDWAALGKIDLRGFNADARASAEWTQSQLTPASRAYLQALPPTRVEADYTMAHGSPRQPIWEYILDPMAAGHNFAVFNTPVCLVGHTHVPALYFMPDGTTNARHCEMRNPHTGAAVQLNSGRWIINPGSVGQPRDGDSDASYALLDLNDNTWELHRAHYSIHETQRRMRERDLPVRLIERLAQGH
jgi:predicted phosphodiesterase